MWRILVLLTGGLGLYAVLFLIIVIGISVSSWQQWLFMGVFGLLFYFTVEGLSNYKKRSARKWRKMEKRKAKLERKKKALQKMEKQRMVE